MANSELQNVVIIEGIALFFIAAVIIASFRHWKFVTYISSVLATIAVFSAWSAAMALGAVLVYAPVAVLLWFDLEKQDLRTPRLICWSFLILGVLLLIFKNVYNVYIKLN